MARTGVVWMLANTYDQLDRRLLIKKFSLYILEIDGMPFIKHKDSCVFYHPVKKFYRVKTKQTKLIFKINYLSMVIGDIFIKIDLSLDDFSFSQCGMNVFASDNHAYLRGKWVTTQFTGDIWNQANQFIKICLN